MANFGPGEADDLAKLPRLDAKIILQELKHRYSKDKIYTYVGDILIAVNPFKTLNIYDKNASRKYKDVVKSEEPPHIYAVADAAYQAMLGKGGNRPYHQCCVISGESGAGKTESAKFFINQVIELSHGESQLEQQILQVNPLLEAFGNAQTVMNDNSSRFGKYIQLKFIKGGVIGAKISEYLLEKSRVALQNAGEENFHIFYYLFSGLSQEEQQTYCLGKPKSYSYLSNGYNSTDAKKNKELFNDLMNAIDLVGFLEEEQTNMFVVLSSVLNMGNIVIDEGEEDDAVVKDQHAVTVTAKLLGMDVEKLKNILTTTSSTTNKGSIIKRRLKEHQASDVRDATAKALYGRLFSWIVNRINRLLAPPASARGHAVMEIGILDIFGFEHFEVNSFEQSCINLANEQLQFFFNQHIFMWEQEEYKREGIDWTTITFEDNKPVLDLFLEKPIGLLALLDEESHFPQSTDQTFVQKLVKNCGKSKHLFTSPHSQNTKFTIGHYAGKVEYDSAGFLEKNRDTLPQSVTEALEKSTNELISSLFSATVTRTGTLALGKGGDKNRKSRVTKPARGLKQQSSNKATVSNQFRTSLTILMEKLTAAHPHFIRCIKPNHMKVSGNFNSEYVEDQLNYTGVLETTRIRREGYPVRPTFEEFVNSYKLIVYDPFLKPSESSSRRILKKSKLGDWHIGKTKVFLKYWHAEELAKKLEEVYRSVIKMQKVVRGFLIRRRKKRLIQASKQHGLKVKDCLQLICLSDSNINKGIKALKEKKRIELIPRGNNTLKYASLDFGKMNQAAGKSTSTASGTQTFSRLEDVKFVDEGVGDFELGEDEFVREPDAIKAKFGAVTTKETAVQWFQETQAPKGAGMEAHGVFHEWFHGVISRRRSEMLLTNKPVGCFLVRVSESRFGYTLSFRVTTRCKHYMIDQTRSGKYIIVGLPKVFKTLSDLVEYHKENPINEDGDVLIEPCGQENEDDADYVDLLTGIASPRRGRPKATMAHVPPPLPERRYKSTMR